MRTYECIAHSGNTGKQIVVFVRAGSSSNVNNRPLTGNDSAFFKHPIELCKQNIYNSKFS